VKETRISGTWRLFTSSPVVGLELSYASAGVVAKPCQNPELLVPDGKT